MNQKLAKNDSFWRLGQSSIFCLEPAICIKVQNTVKYIVLYYKTLATNDKADRKPIPRTDHQQFSRKEDGFRGGPKTGWQNYDVLGIY
jgi:hypothetical protein